MARPHVIKFGGELLEEPPRLRRLARRVCDAATRRRVLVVHGGGREVDAEMARLGIPKRAVDGLRITDADTLDVVLGVLAGRVNTRVVAAIGAAGGSAVGLTGADAGLVRVAAARRYRATDGRQVDLAVQQRPVEDRHDRLGRVEGQRTQPGTESAGEHDGLHAIRVQYGRHAARSADRSAR